MSGVDGAHVEYDSNNSGGNWWLSDDQWKALEEAGWTVDWVANQESKRYRDKDGNRWLGALATNASYPGSDLRAAIESWERVTGESSNALGCGCCGPPHSFTSYSAENRWLDSYSPSYPDYGDEY